MVGPQERACYYWLARHHATGRGVIVDAGSFLGASTFAFAAGAADAGRQDWNGRPVVHAFDYFQVIDTYVGEAISRAKRPIAKGESYLDIFQAQTAAYAGLIQTHPGDFLRQTWPGDPVEILFVDVAKTPRLNGHVARLFYPALIPGHSVLIQQDYFHAWHPYIHIGMEYLAEEFELLDDRVPHQSAVWQLIRPIPAEKILALAANALAPDLRLQLLDRLIEKSSEALRPMIELIRVWEQAVSGDLDAARSAFASYRARHDIETTRALWARQAQQMDQKLTTGIL